VLTCLNAARNYFMRWSYRAATALIITFSSVSAASAQSGLSLSVPKSDAKMPWSGQTPGKPHPGLCLLTYRVSTNSPECQAFFDQGLAYYYSYVYMEACRSFETATRFDPDCAMAWWGLSRALEQHKRGGVNEALQIAQKLLPKVSHRESFLITARLQEKGMAPGTPPDQRKKLAAKSLDELLTLYDDDEEGWFYRAQLSDGGVSAVPYYKALLHVNPLHPGANHELVHFYEGHQRPALGWIYAENYIKSSPGIPHPFHMQAHLATRLGRWDKTGDRSARAIELERAYHQELNVKPSEDYQYPHHLEILTLSLIHDGRFQEARTIKAEVARCGYKQELVWFRLHLAERAWDEALKLVEAQRKSDKLTGSYLAALLYLKQGDPARAAPEIEVLQHAYAERKTDSALEYRLWETQGLLLCETGAADAGLKLLTRAVEKSKNDFWHHSWGNGAYYMEAWGIAALHAGNDEAAEEAFLEALAHDPGSVRAALGMQVLCERRSRSDEAQRYSKLAHRCWGRADSGALDAELAGMRKGDWTAQTAEK
jgi:tetratricopeptide (TPR) repeat protein